MGVTLFRRDDGLQRGHSPSSQSHALLLHAEEYDEWLDAGFDEAVAFQERCNPDDLIEMERTSDLWAKRRTVAPLEGAPTRL